MAYTTKKTLLEAIKDGDEISWHEFYATYRPLIMLRGSDFYLSQTEKEELVQAVLLEVFRMCKTFRYDRSKGRFRDYLRQIIGSKSVAIVRQRRTDFSIDILDDCPDENLLLEQTWQGEWQIHILSQAMEVLRGKVDPATYQAFELNVIDEMPAHEVAVFLRISVDMVYVAKSRVVKQLRSIISKLEE